MRQSLVCQTSTRVLRNLAKARVRRKLLPRPVVENAEDGEVEMVNDVTTVSLPRTLSAHFRDNSQKLLEGMLSTPGTTYQSIWESYLTLREATKREGGAPLPLELFQAVLRRCMPAWITLRTAAMKPTTEHGELQRLRSPLPYENRLQIILRDMKGAKHTPTIDDFNHIIKQMSAVGHVQGAMAVLKEIDATKGITPTAATYTLVLKTCVFLIESNFPQQVRSLVVKASTEVATDIIERMQSAGTGMSAPTLESILRIFKEDGNIEACEQVLRSLCAFDVRRPDRMPEEFETRLKEADRSGEPLPVPLPVTTSMFTTMMNLYGSRGDLPRMITMFEVLTNPYPLPSNLPSPSSDWWDDDAEYDVANPVIQTPLKHRPEYVWAPQKSSPNSATFAAVLRNLAWAGQRMLCEHYILLAEEYDKQEAKRLRTQLSNEAQLYRSLFPQNADSTTISSPDLKRIVIPAPRFLITPLMFMPVFAYANRQRILELIRWMRYHLRGIIRRREKELTHFKNFAAALPPDYLLASRQSQPNSKHSPYEDYTGIVEGTDPVKPLDLQLHIKLVEESLKSFRAMLDRADEVVARLKQRSLENMTRRVWSNKDIFLRETNSRVFLSREDWEKRVQWRAWAGPITGNQLGQASHPSSFSGPTRWMDERLRSRLQAKENLNSNVAIPTSEPVA